VRFYLNGIDQGVAFAVPPRTFYPAVSLYGPARVRANFGPTWLATPPGAEELPLLSPLVVPAVSFRTAAVGSIRAIAELKMLPKIEAEEHAQSVILTEKIVSLTLTT
jgi:hypothetical protein